MLLGSRQPNAEVWAWSRVAGKLPSGRGSDGAGWQLAEHEPVVCPGGQEGHQTCGDTWRHVDMALKGLVLVEGLSRPGWWLDLFIVHWKNRLNIYYLVNNHSTTPPRTLICIFFLLSMILNIFGKIFSFCLFASPSVNQNCWFYQDKL